MLYLRRWLIVFFEPVNAICGVAASKGLDVVLERPLVLEVGPANAVPELPAVLLMSPPVAPDRERLATLAAHERLDTMLALVVRLQCPEVLERLCPWVVNVVPATRRAAVAGKPEHACWLCASQRLGAFPVLRSMPPHMHLHVVVTVEGLETNRARELGRANEDLGWGWDPVLPLVYPAHQVPTILPNTMFLIWLVVMIMSCDDL